MYPVILMVLSGLITLSTALPPLILPSTSNFLETNLSSTTWGNKDWPKTPFSTTLRDGNILTIIQYDVGRWARQPPISESVAISIGNINYLLDLDYPRGIPAGKAAYEEAEFINPVSPEELLTVGFRFNALERVETVALDNMMHALQTIYAERPLTIDIFRAYLMAEKKPLLSFAMPIY